MIRISFAILTLVFVQLVNGQMDACQQATANLDANSACVDALGTGTDVNTICMGTCRGLFDAIITECNEAVASDISNLISTLCDDGTGDACTTAQQNLQANTACYTAINQSDIDAICMETCQNLLTAIVSSCSASDEAALVSSMLLGYCDSGTTAACLTAAEAINDDTCLEYLNTANSAVCSGTCNTQVSAAATACADSTDSNIEAFVSAYETACNTNDTQCQAVLGALNANDDCVDALNDDNTETFCSAPCSELINATLNTCPNNAFIRERRTGYNVACGTGTGTGNGNGTGTGTGTESGSVIIQASGIVTLLLVAMCALLL